MKENSVMRKRLSISISSKIASYIEEEARKGGKSFSQVASEYIERYIALRNKVFVSLEKKFTKEELKKLKEVSQRLFENPITKESVLYELKENKELTKKVEELSECELNLLLSYLESN
ncbi:MAG: hypothetical protein DSY32_03600 [Aquifex sp.]|nr:MAG: hypothetical protein DSY32_03600 [Aquifex sp.]